MKKIKVDLKPCLFCGGTSEVKQFANPKNFYTVDCSNCHCRTDGFVVNRVNATDRENIQANAAVWNSRVEIIPDEGLTRGDNIRKIIETDDGLADFLIEHGLSVRIDFCKNKPECSDLMDCEKTVPDEMCRQCLINCLKEDLK